MTSECFFYFHARKMTFLAIRLVFLTTAYILNKTENLEMSSFLDAYLLMIDLFFKYR